MPATEERDALLPEESFARAKTDLSQWMTAVVQRRRPLVVSRNRGREHAVLLDRRDLALMLEGYSFSPKVSVSDGEFVIRLPELNLVAGGATIDEAVTELEGLAEAHADNYLDRVDFYLQTDRRRELPWVMRLALTPPSERRELFTSQVPGSPGEHADEAVDAR